MKIRIGKKKNWGLKRKGAFTTEAQKHGAKKKIPRA